MEGRSKTTNLLLFAITIALSLTAVGIWTAPSLFHFEKIKIIDEKIKVINEKIKVIGNNNKSYYTSLQSKNLLIVDKLNKLSKETSNTPPELLYFDILCTIYFNQRAINDNQPGDGIKKITYLPVNC